MREGNGLDKLLSFLDQNERLGGQSEGKHELKRNQKPLFTPGMLRL